MPEYNNPNATGIARGVHYDIAEGDVAAITDKDGNRKIQHDMADRTACGRNAHGRLRITEDVSETTCKACRRTLDNE